MILGTFSGKFSLKISNDQPCHYDTTVQQCPPPPPEGTTGGGKIATINCKGGGNMSLTYTTHSLVDFLKTSKLCLDTLFLNISYYFTIFGFELCWRHNVIFKITFQRPVWWSGMNCSPRNNELTWQLCYLLLACKELNSYQFKC